MKKSLSFDFVKSRTVYNVLCVVRMIVTVFFSVTKTFVPYFVRDCTNSSTNSVYLHINPEIQPGL